MRQAPAARSLPNAPTTQAHDAFYAGLRANAAATVSAATPSRDDRVGQKLDDLRSAYSGPYHAEGQTVSASAMFAMNGGFSRDNAKANGKEALKIAGPDANAAMLGIATPKQIVKVTQALVDAGKLPPGPGDLATRIKAMQWHYGIGVDCACYTRMALQAATGKPGEQLGLAPLGSEGFRNLGSNGHFAKVRPEAARPGDIMTLDSRDGDAGHNVIVRSRTALDDAAKQALTVKWGKPASRFLSGAGPFHQIQVDSSWGAGETGETTGGVRRDTWIYDEGSKMWASVNQHESPPRLRVGTGPANDAFHGAYRAKES